jgi:delta 1-pyrroline-5-carboxylate dehydrogenase
MTLGTDFRSARLRCSALRLLCLRLSGTGPKAGGPNYLKRFATEQVVSINTAVAGGNASLLTMEE